MDINDLSHNAVWLLNTGVLLWIAIKITRLETLWEAHKEWHKTKDED